MVSEFSVKNFGRTRKIIRTITAIITLSVVLFSEISLKRYCLPPFLS